MQGTSRGPGVTDVIYPGLGMSGSVKTTVGSVRRPDMKPPPPGRVVVVVDLVAVDVVVVVGGRVVVVVVDDDVVVGGRVVVVVVDDDVVVGGRVVVVVVDDDVVVVVEAPGGVTVRVKVPVAPPYPSTTMKYVCPAVTVGVMREARSRPLALAHASSLHPAAISGPLPQTPLRK